jgi:uncharacterized damage-inducible protein DinB
MSKKVLEHLAAYNTWANTKVYATCGNLTNDDRKRAMGASFGSVHGTLNHLLLVDQLWLSRFLNEPFVAGSVREEFYAEFDNLRRERQLTDARLEAWMHTLDDDALDSDLTFTTITKGQRITMPLGRAALHVFNHQTYHRGQVASLVRQLGHTPPETDLLYMSL